MLNPAWKLLEKAPPRRASIKHFWNSPAMAYHRLNRQIKIQKVKEANRVIG